MNEIIWIKITLCCELMLIWGQKSCAAQYLGMELQLPYQELRQQIANGTRKEFPDNGISFASAGSGLLNTNEQCVR